MSSPLDLNQALLTQFTTAAWVFTNTLEGISHEESLVQPAPAGNCLNWVAGHVTNSRLGMLELFGTPLERDTVWSERYKRGSDPLADGEGAADFSEIVEVYNATQAPLQTGLLALTPERLAETAPFSPGKNEQETVGSLLATLTFHESYHVGQLGLLRRLLGRDGLIK